MSELLIELYSEEIPPTLQISARLQLEKLFTKYVDYDFTAKLEDQLDDITSGKENWIKVLENFWKVPKCLRKLWKL